MEIKISKQVTLNDIRAVFEGDIPEYHPISYIHSRINDGMSYIAKDDTGCPVGFLIYNIWWGNCPFIELIKIRKSCQRQGVGLKLLDTVKQDLKNKKFEKLISSTEVINPLGLGFHDKAGFEKINNLNLPHGEEQFYSMSL